MIIITNIREIGRVDADSRFAVVRSLKQPIDGVVQISTLAPSWDLMRTYFGLRDAGKWNKESFRSIYVPQFLTEMKRPAARTALNELYLMDKADKRVALACFCTNETLCHRSILAGLLQGAGCNVSAGADYSEYFEMLKNIKE